MKTSETTLKILAEGQARIDALRAATKLFRQAAREFRKIRRDLEALPR